MRPFPRRAFDKVSAGPCKLFGHFIASPGGFAVARSRAIIAQHALQRGGERAGFVFPQRGYRIVEKRLSIRRPEQIVYENLGRGSLTFGLKQGIIDAPGRRLPYFEGLLRIAQLKSRDRANQAQRLPPGLHRSLPPIVRQTPPRRS